MRERKRAARHGMVLLASCWVVACMGLAACGGGGTSDGDFDISLTVDGQATGDFGTGSSPAVYVQAGQTLVFYANEPVVWTLYVGQTAVAGSGSTVVYGNASITLTAVSPSTISVSTASAALLAQPVPVTLVATSSYDSATVGVVDVYITN